MGTSTVEVSDFVKKKLKKIENITGMKQKALVDNIFKYGFVHPEAFGLSAPSLKVQIIRELNLDD